MAEDTEERSREAGWVKDPFTEMTCAFGARQEPKLMGSAFICVNQRPKAFSDTRDTEESNIQNSKIEIGQIPSLSFNFLKNLRLTGTVAPDFILISASRLSCTRISST